MGRGRWPVGVQGLSWAYVDLGISPLERLSADVIGQICTQLSIEPWHAGTCGLAGIVFHLLLRDHATDSLHFAMIGAGVAWALGARRFT